MKKRFYFVLFILFAGLLTSCATSVGMKVTRPAEVNLEGAKTIAILPFRTDSSNYYYDTFDFFTYMRFFSEKSYMKKYLQEKGIVENFQKMIEDELARSSDLIIINSESALRFMEKGKTCPADVYITGSMQNFINDVDEKSITKKVDDEIIVNTSCKRSVSFTMKYQIVNAATNKILHSDTFYVSESSLTEKYISDLPSSYELVKNDLYRQAKDIADSVIPHEETRYLSLLDVEDHSEMEKAKELAENDLIEQCYKKYYDIYKREKLFEAGYNAAIILEAQTKFEDAKALAEDLVSNFDDKRAYKLLKDIKNEIAQRNEYLKQTSYSIDAK